MDNGGTPAQSQPVAPQSQPVGAQSPPAEAQSPPAGAQHQPIDDAVSELRHIDVVPPASGESHPSAAGREVRLKTSSSSTEQPLAGGSEGHPVRPRFDSIADYDDRPLPPPPRARNRDGPQTRTSSRRHTFFHSGHPSTSALDHLVPVEEKPHRHPVGERLKPTIEEAIKARNNFARKALLTSYTLNIAIGIQVLLGALTTGLAAAIKSANQAQVSTAILGGLATLVASYLARARGSGEPELSTARVKDLDHFVRECNAFKMDHEHEYANSHNNLDARLDELRRRFEELLGNVSGERKFSPVGITANQGAGLTQAVVPTSGFVTTQPIAPTQGFVTTQAVPPTQGFATQPMAPTQGFATTQPMVPAQGPPSAHRLV